MPNYRIVIRKDTNTLTLYDGSKVVKTYPVATGRSKVQTPEGVFHIVLKTWWPSWTNPETGQTIRGGSLHNPLGSRWLGLDVGKTRGRSYGIHGTNNPSSIGSHVTHGCVRMYNRDVEELYNLVPIGTRVTIRA